MNIFHYISQRNFYIFIIIIVKSNYFFNTIFFSSIKLFNEEFILFLFFSYSPPNQNSFIFHIICFIKEMFNIFFRHFH